MLHELKVILQNRRNRAEVYSKAEYWNGKAAKLEGKAASMWPNNHLNELYHAEIISAFDAHLPDLKDRRLLEVGSGTGRLSRHFASLGAAVTGIDFAERAVAIARSHTSGSNPTYRVQSIHDLEDRDCYDAVVTWGCLVMACRNRDDVLDALERMRAALKAQGLMVLMEPMHTGFLSRVLRMSPGEFVETAGEAKLVVERVQHLHFWPARLALAYVQWPRAFTRALHDRGERVMNGAFAGKRLGDYQIYRLRRRS